MHAPTRGALALLLAAAPSLGAQTPAAAPSTAAKVAVRPLPAAAATSAETFGAVAAVRALPNGGLLVNDQARRRVLMLDSTLKTVAVVVDSASGTENAYGPRGGGLIAYHGDTTLFLDPAALSMLVIDPAGKIVRVMAAPRPSDAQFLVGGPFGNPGFDSRGRLVYRAFGRPQFMGGGGGPGGAPGGGGAAPAMPDSAALVRFDLATRKLDTLAFFKIPRSGANVTRDANGGVRVSMQINPLPLVDDWAVMSDGSVAIVRGREYRVEFLGADGSRTLADKIPHDWQRMSDEDKVAFVDSAKAAFERNRAAMTAAGGAGGAGNVTVSGGQPGGGAPAQVITFQVGPGGGAPPARGGAPGAGGAGGAPGGGAMTMPTPTFINPSELPDYKPAFGLGSVRADADGRLWVRTIPTKPVPGGAVYDVIDRTGKLVDRVQVPAGTTIAGFGPGKIVYLGMRDAAGLRLQRIVSR